MKIPLLDDMIRDAGTIAMAGHIRPDGDCVGSCLAVYNYIKENYPEKECFAYLDHVPERFRFLPHADQIRHPGKKPKQVDLFLALDCADQARLDSAEPIFLNAKKTICIDHHISNPGFAHENYVFPDASSASEIVFETMKPDAISKNTAECLYVGIVCDTGVFQYSCTSAHTMQIGGVLMDKGINYPRLVDHVFFQKNYTQKKMLGRTLEKSSLYLNGKVIASHITQEDMKEMGAIGADLDGIVSELRSTKGVEVAIFLHEEKNGDIKVSLRSAEYIDVAKIAGAYGGGGHARAAGATVKMEPDVILSELCEAISQQMEQE